MTLRLESRLLLTARLLVLILPLCLTGGRAAVDIALSLVAVLFLVRSAVTHDWSWARSTWFKVGAGLWLWMLFLSFFAYDVGLSFSQAVPWIRFLLFAAALEVWVLDEIWMRRLLWVATATLVFVSLDALLQYFTGTNIYGDPRWSEDRLTGVFERPRVGIFITKLMFPVVLGAFAWHAWRRGKILPTTLFVALVTLLLATVFLSGERMALLLAMLGLIFAAVLQRGLVRKLVIGALTLAVASVLALAVFNPKMVNRHVDQTIHTIEHLGESDYGQIWNSGLHLVMEHPVLGAGMKNFRVACPTLDLPNPTNAIRCSTHPHNLYLEWACEAGIPGLLGVILLIAVLFRRIREVAHRYGYGVWLLGPTVSMMVHLWPLGPSGSFFSNWAGGMLWLAVGWALAASRLIENTARSSAPASPARSP